MSIITTRAERRELARANARLPTYLQGIPRDDWPAYIALSKASPLAVWRSRDYLVQQACLTPPYPARNHE